MLQLEDLCRKFSTFASSCGKTFRRRNIWNSFCYKTFKLNFLPKTSTSDLFNWKGSMYQELHRKSTCPWKHARNETGPKRCCTSSVECSKVLLQLIWNIQKVLRTILMITISYTFCYKKFTLNVLWKDSAGNFCIWMSITIWYGLHLTYLSPVYYSLRCNHVLLLEMAWRSMSLWLVLFKAISAQSIVSTLKLRLDTSFISNIISLPSS